MRSSMLSFFMLIFASTAQAREMDFNLDFSRMKNVYSKVFTGSHDTSSHKSCTFYGLTDGEEAKLYNQAVAKLRNITLWAKLVSIPGQEFKLINSQGQGVYRQAMQGDYIRIKLPADPTGRYYWVRIEKIVSKSLPTGEASVSMVVRPSEKPNASGRTKHYTDHFFTKAATNTFIIKRTRSGLESRVEGRNEIANTTEAPTKWDGISNTTIAMMGWGVNVNDTRLGFQPLVWRRFNTSLADCTL